jgi:malate dehydrogenase (oxaloacetate-decarboxylating)(NADP+)
VGKRIDEVKVVCSGAGAAALACLDLLVRLGVRMENITVSDIKGVVYKGRKEEMDPLKERYAKETHARTLGEIIEGADVFLGLSAGGVLKKEMVARMAARPLIMALANPTPEIMPEEVKSVRDDAVMATGRSDYPNQVNNVLCFPFIFRGALDVGASSITEEMKMAAVHAIAELTREEPSDVVAAMYGMEPMTFGPEYLIPKPFDPRLIVRIAPAVARAAMESGVATRPIQDWDAYRSQLNQFVYHSGLIMRPVFAAAKASPQRVIYSEGEEERVLRAVQTVVDESLARPIVIGRPDVVNMRIERARLRIRPGVDFELVNQDSDPRFRELWTYYHRRMERSGVSVEDAKRQVRQRTTLIGALLIQLGYADGMICGTHGAFSNHLDTVRDVIGMRPGVKTLAAMNALLLPGRTVFVCDTYVNYDPTAEQVAEMAVIAAEEVERFGITPKVALLSHSSFGTHDTPTAVKMREALRLLGEIAPQLEVDGEMHGDAALSEDIRRQVFPNSRLKGDANLLIAPTLDAANISYNLLKAAAGEGVTIGPLLLGAAKPVHVLSQTATSRRIVNVTALTAVAASALGARQK